MSKRRLTQQQLRRIHKNQRSKSELVGGSEFNIELQGLILAHHGQQLIVENLSNKKTYRCYARSNLPPLATGDKVIWRLNEAQNNGVVEALIERSSLIERPHTHRGLKPIAANIDVLAIVSAVSPKPFPNLIDRYLVAATNAKLKAILILNKIDLLTNVDDYCKQFELYQQLHYPLFALSSQTGEGIDKLQAYLSAQTSIFVGQSGVGKSSLLNCLLPEAHSKTSPLSNAEAKGKHTTTAAQFYHAPFGGAIIDSPGIREFGLWHLAKKDIAKGFIEFQPFLGQCKFRDCLHAYNSEHCAIQQAIMEQKIHPQRLASYLSILNSLDEHQDS